MLQSCWSVWVYGRLGEIQLNFITEKKSNFGSNLTMENTTYADYKHAKRVWKKNFGLPILGQYHDLYVQNDTLLLIDVFEGFYELDPAHFISAPGLAQWTCLKKTEVELE